MHRQNFAHRGTCIKIFRIPYKKCTVNNIVVDRDPPHFYLDYTLSQQLKPQNRVTAQWDHYYWDIYCFGNLVRKKFKQVRFTMPIITGDNNTDGIRY